MKRICFILALLLAFSGPVRAEDADALMAQSKSLIEQQKYDEALQLLEQAKKQEPKNDDIKLMIAQIHGWQHKYDTAEAELQDIQQRHPDDKDVANAIVWIRQARSAPTAYQWQLDAGYEHSSFARRPQTSWNQQYGQIDDLLGDTTLHGRVDRYEEFNHVDIDYEAGVSHRFTPRINGYLTANMAPDALFRPRWSLAGGGELRVDPESANMMPVWMTLDTSYDDYDAAVVRNINPGLRIEPAEDWAFSPKMIAVNQKGAGTVVGWLTRIDGRFAPGWRFNVGYADAPDTEDAITAYTKTIFGGITVDLDPAHTIYLSYTHDDRENSYIRHVVDVGISYRF